MYREVDTNDSGSITLDEFKKWSRINWVVLCEESRADGVAVKQRIVVHRRTQIQTNFQEDLISEGGGNLDSSSTQDEYSPRLLLIKHLGDVKSQDIQYEEIAMQNSSLNDRDVFILDLGQTIFLFFPPKSTRQEKVRSRQIMNQIVRQSGAKETHTVEWADSPDIPAVMTFWKILGGKPNQLQKIVDIKTQSSRLVRAQSQSTQGADCLVQSFDQDNLHLRKTQSEIPLSKKTPSVPVRRSSPNPLEAALEEAFFLCDTERTGSITLKVFILALRNTTIKNQLRTILGGDHFNLKMFQWVDVEKRNIITLTQWKAWVSINWVWKGSYFVDIRSKQPSVQNLEDAFNLCDPDRNGQITLTEFIRSNVKRDTKEKLVGLLGGDFFTLNTFRGADLDNTDTITMNEFVEWAKENWIFWAGKQELLVE